MTKYEQGFISKCAEMGIDYRELIKSSQVWSTFGGAGKKLIPTVVKPYSTLIPSKTIMSGDIANSVNSLHYLRDSISKPQMKQQLGSLYSSGRNHLQSSFTSDIHNQWNQLAAKYGIPEVNYARLGKEGMYKLSSIKRNFIKWAQLKGTNGVPIMRGANTASVAKAPTPVRQPPAAGTVLMGPGADGRLPEYHGTDRVRAQGNSWVSNPISTNTVASPVQSVAASRPKLPNMRNIGNSISNGASSVMAGIKRVGNSIGGGVSNAIKQPINNIKSLVNEGKSVIQPDTPDVAKRRAENNAFMGTDMAGTWGALSGGVKGSVQRASQISKQPDMVNQFRTVPGNPLTLTQNTVQ